MATRKRAIESKKGGRKIGAAPRRRTEQLLREPENPYRSIFETTGTATIIVEEDMTISLANAGLEKLIGYSREEVEGRKKWTDFVLEEDLEKMKEYHFARRKDPGSAPRSYEFRLPDRQGNIKNVLLTAALIPGTRKTVASIWDLTERKRAEEALRRSEKDYRSVIENIQDVFYRADLHGRLTMGSPSGGPMFGYDLIEEVLGRRLESFWVDPKERVSFMARMKAAGEVKDFETVFKKKDGSPFHVSLTAHFYRDDRGNPLGMEGIIRDITERKRAEEGLRESEQSLRRTFDQAPLGAAILSLDNRYLRVNAELCRITGYSEQELLSMGFPDITHPDELEKSMEFTRRILAGEIDSYKLDKRYIRKDGKIIWVRLFAHLVKDASGKPLQFFPMVEDITDRKRAEDALAESQEKYRLVVENASDAIFILQNGAFQFFNARCLELSGYSAEELSRMSFADLIHPEERKAAQDRYLRRIAGDKLSPGYTYRGVNRSGEVVWVQAHSVPTLWKGKPATINFVRDITQEKKLEGHLLQAQKMEAIGTLAGGIAHDFNNILTAILGYAELANLELQGDSKVKNNLQQCIKATYRAKELVSQILAFSRQGKQERKLLNIAPLVKEGLGLLRATLPATIEIRQDLEKGAGAVEADPTQIHQILMNLGTNAGHAMSEHGGILEVALANAEVDGTAAAAAGIDPGPYLRLRVADTGSGMPPDVLKKIFDPYFTTKEVGKGTGLGLAVVHGIVKSHGGGILVSSEEGKGSAFDIYFPRVDVYKAFPAAEKSESVPLLGSERILLVDDELTIVEVGRSLLEHLGYEVAVRTSSVEALELFRVNPGRFDLVITDMTMPNLTGDQLAEELLRIRPGIPIILCTGFSERISEEKAKALGIQEFVMKPLVIKDLARSVRRALDSRMEKKG